MPPPTSTTVPTDSQSPLIEHLGVGSAVPGRSHQGIEARGDLRVGLQVLPEGAAEDGMVQPAPGSHGGKQAAPRVRHPATDPVEVQTRAHRRIEERVRWLVKLEAA